jgi:hypothetical protein
MFALRLKVWSIRFFIKYIIYFVFSYFFIYPEADKNYEGFFNGLIIGGLHGSFAITNKIISLFDGRLIMAQTGTTLYIVVWWLSLISTLIDDLYHFYKSFWRSLLD